MVRDADAGAVEARRVQVPLVLMERLAQRGRPDGHGDVVAGRLEEVGAGQARGVSAPVRHEDPPAARSWTAEDVPCLRNLHPRKREVGIVRPRAGGDDDRVGRQRGHALGVTLRLEADLDVPAFEQAPVVAGQRARELGVHRRRAGQRDLAADSVAPLEQHDLVPGGRRLGGRGEAGGASAHDDDAPPGRGARRRAQGALPARARVLRAGDGGAGVVMRDARVAGDAAEDVGESSLPRLARQVRIGDERAGHPRGVAAPVGDEPVRLDGIDDSRRGDQRWAHAERRRQRSDRVLGQGRRRHDAGRASVRGGGTEGDADVVHRPRPRGRRPPPRPPSPQRGGRRPRRRAPPRARRRALRAGSEAARPTRRHAGSARA